jgi:hypothetical protein
MTVKRARCGKRGLGDTSSKITSKQEQERRGEEDW